MTNFERVALYALLISITALSLDMLLPLLPTIAQEFKSSDSNQIYFVISAVIFGMIFGEIIFGPLADAIGRKPALIIGLAVFLFGTIIALTAHNLTWLLIGRAIQGIGVSGPKIATRALIRDQFQAAQMARMMSMVFFMLIGVTMLAPILGQWLGNALGWRSIFYFYLIITFVAGGWLLLRHKETLPRNARTPLLLKEMLKNLNLILKNGRVLSYTCIAGLVFGAQLTFLSVAQSIFDKTYGRADSFVYWVAALSLCIGLSSLLNSYLVMRKPMDYLVGFALSGLGFIGAILFTFSQVSDTYPPFIVFITATAFAFGCIGTVFGNINAMAMTYLGRVAGLGASVISSVSSLIAFALAAFMSQIHDGTPFALSICFMIAGLGGLTALIMARQLDEISV
ncbi:MFS transporter [Ahrensia kielensis]|uniref:MFS transporter n=1 Tax=Ahrensia kielensis TaxID=76980 RepID=UPI0003643B87|nr:MFS transporter [Ahrensia kielensis]